MNFRVGNFPGLMYNDDANPSSNFTESSESSFMIDGGVIVV